MGKNKGMKTIHAWYGAALLLFGSLVSCMGTVGNSSMRGGEVIGASAVAWNEPAPYGMVLVKRGSVKMGPDKQDSLWGTIVPSREISVESFWMDDTEVTVAEYKQFVNWVRDSIIRERLADPAYGGNGLTDDTVKHFTIADPLYEKEKKEWLKLYIPARTAVVLKNTK